MADTKRMEAFGDVEIIIDGRNQRSVTATIAILETAQWLESLVGVFILLYREVRVLYGFNFIKWKEYCKIRGFLPLSLSSQISSRWLNRIKKEHSYLTRLGSRGGSGLEPRLKLGHGN